MTQNELTPGDVYEEKSVEPASEDNVVEDEHGEFNRLVVCPVCEEEMLLYGNDDLIMDCHRDCLTDDEEDLLEAEEDKQEEKWDRAEVREMAEKQERKTVGLKAEGGE